MKKIYTLAVMVGLKYIKNPRKININIESESF